MNIKWNAEGYRDNFSFVHEYGNDVMSLLTVPQGSFIVDLGCGNGNLMPKLVEKGYEVLGIDASSDMLAIAKERYPDYRFIQADATAFNLDRPADAIFSNAVFHWIDDQDALLANIARNLRTGGELVFEFGGKGNAEAIHATLEKCFVARRLPYPRTFQFFDIAEYASKLAKHGLQVRSAFLFDRPTPQVGENGLENWIRMFLTNAFKVTTKQIGDEIIAEAVDTLRDRLYIDGTWYVDYVRLRMRCIKL